MATQLKPDAFAPVTPAPFRGFHTKPNIRVAFSAGAATLAIRDKMADTPDAGKTLEEIALQSLTSDLLVAARKHLSPVMYAAFLRWGEEAIRFTTLIDTDDELNAQAVRHDDALYALSETAAETPSDMCLKAYIAAVEMHDRGGVVGPIDIANRPDWPFGGATLAVGFVVDILAMSPVTKQLNDIAARAWEMSGFGSAWTREVGLPLAQMFADAGANRFEAMRLEWVQHCAGINAIGNDEDPRFTAMNNRMMEIERQMARDPSLSVEDASAKLQFATDTANEGVPLDGEELHLIVSDAARFLVRPAIPAADTAIIDAYAARRREFEASFDRDIPHEEEAGYFARLDAAEGVLCDTSASTIEGVIAKLRIAFMHEDGSAWADRAILDPTHPEFVAGLAGSDMYTRLKWSAIEDLARIGGVNLAEQGRAA